jgi:predicted permease
MSILLYRALLRLYPKSFRAQFGDEMVNLFADRLHVARRDAGVRGWLARWARTLPDILISASGEHLAERKARRARSQTTSSYPEHSMLTAIGQDLRYAARMMRRNPVFTAVSIAVIGIGTGAVSTIFSVANAIALHPIPGVADPSRVVTIQRTHADGSGSISASYPYFAELASHARTMSGVAAWDLVNLTVSTGGEGTASLGDIVSGNYFNVLGVKPALGRFFSGDETRVRDRFPVIVLSHEFWQRRFAGDSSILGREVLMNERRFTVIGVAPVHFNGLYPVLRTDVWVPLMMQQSLRRGGDLLSQPGSAWLQVFGRLAPNATNDAARVELANLTKRWTSSGDTGEPRDLAVFTGATVTRALGLPSEATRLVFGFFAILLVVAGLVLLIASVNVASMLLARAVARRREIAVRVALGAGRGRVVRQLLTESLALFALGGAVGLVLAVFGTRLLAQIPLPPDIPFALDLAPDMRVVGVTLLVALMTGAIFGLAPAMQAARADVVANLRGDSAGSGRARSRLRTTLIVCQVAASLLLLTTSALFVRALDRGHRIDVGLDPRHVEIAGFDVRTSGYDEPRARQFYSDFRDRVASLPGVDAVSYARVVPLSANTTGIDISIPGYTPPNNNGKSEFVVLADYVDEGYATVLHTPIVDGRDLARSDNEHASRVAVVNESFAKAYWPGGRAIGRSITIDSKRVTIVGVVRDSRFRRIGEAPVPFLFLPIAQNWRSDMIMLVRASGDPAALGPSMQRELHALNPNIPVPSMTTFEQSIEVGLLPQRVAVMVTGALGVAGLLLAAIGLYGVVSYTAAQRTREIGVRVALGAVRHDVITLVVRDGMRLVAMGVGVGLLLAFAATQALRPFLFGVSPLDAVAFVGMTALLIVAAFVASYLPARRAAALDPMAALRE